MSYTTPTSFRQYIPPLNLLFPAIRVKYVTPVPVYTELTHEDIPVSSTISLSDLRKNLLADGYYKKEIESIIDGLSQLPEYARSHRSSKGSKKA